MKRRGWPGRENEQQGGIIGSLITLVFLVVLASVIYLARHPILRFVGESWVIEDPLDRADAILVLSDDNFFADRSTRAAEVYRQGLAPIVVASGRRLRPYAGVSELMEHDLVERGVPKDKIIKVAHNAQNTRDEAQELARVAVERKWRKVIVVTSNYHTRRARYIFQRIFPARVSVRVTGARDGSFDPERWWEKRVSVKQFARELAGMAVAVWEVGKKDRVEMKIPSVVGLRGLSLLQIV